MARILLLAAAAILGGGAMPPGRVPLGQYGRWVALRDPRPDRCYAVVAPLAGNGSLFVSTWPARGVRLAVELRLAWPATSVALGVDGAPATTLAVAGPRAWAADERVAGRLVAAMRRGASVRVETRDGSGRRRRLVFPLPGGPSAIDAALVGCRRH